VDLLKKEPLGSFETPHLEAVTALEVMDGTLISG